MTDRARLLAILREAEGTGPRRGDRLLPYRDTQGLLTIGYGRCLDRVGISLGEAEVLLDHDVATAEGPLLSALPWVAGLAPARRAALIELAFNMGLGVPGTSGLLSFTRTLPLVRAGQYEAAAGHLLDSKWRTDVQDRRALRVAAQLRTGQWPAAVDGVAP